MSNETAWLASTKDDSAIEWAEKTITAAVRESQQANPAWPWLPDGKHKGA